MQIRQIERSLLGGLLEYPGSLVDVADIVKPSDFYDMQLGKVFSIYLARSLSGKQIDQVETPMVISRLVNEDVLIGILTEVGRSGVNPADLRFWAQAISQEAVRRDAIGELDNARRALDECEDPMPEVHALGAKLLGIGGGSQVDRPFAAVVADSIESAQRTEPLDPGISTGLSTVDEFTRLERGNIYIVAGRPGSGKSALAAQVVLADEGRSKIGIFSMEMPAKMWVDRLICADACVDSRRYRSARLSEWERRNALESAARIKGYSVRIDERGGLTMAQVIAKARKWAMLGGLDVLIVDYLQLMMGERGQSTYDSVSDHSKSFKKLAKTLDIPIILLAQLNRKCEDRQDKRPVAADLLQSGQIENDADVILMVYRGSMYNDHTCPVGTAELLIVKQRSGSTGVAKVRWEATYTRFSDFPPVEVAA